MFPWERAWIDRESKAKYFLYYRLKTGGETYYPLLDEKELCGFIDEFIKPRGYVITRLVIRGVKELEGREVQEYIKRICGKATRRGQ